MKNIPDHSVDFILCDPPYGTTDCKWDAIIPFDALWSEYKRIIKPYGVVALFAAQPFTSNLVMSNPKAFSHVWYWLKNTCTGHLLAKKQPMRCVEDICVFVLNNNNNNNNKGCHNALRAYMWNELDKSGLKRSDINRLTGTQMSSHYFTDGEQFAIPSKSAWAILQSTGHWQRDWHDVKAEFDAGKPERESKLEPLFTYNPQGLIPTKIVRKRPGNCELWRKQSNEPTVQKFTNYPKQVLEFKNECGLHPTQKPVALLEYLVNTYSNPGELVLDNCMGSGSTGVACANTGRRFIGIEKEQKYFDMASERIADAFSCAKSD